MAAVLRQRRAVGPIDRSGTFVYGCVKILLPPPPPEPPTTMPGTFKLSAPHQDGKTNAPQSGQRLSIPLLKKNASRSGTRRLKQFSINWL